MYVNTEKHVHTSSFVNSKEFCSLLALFFSVHCEERLRGKDRVTERKRLIRYGYRCRHQSKSHESHMNPYSPWRLWDPLCTWQEHQHTASCLSEIKLGTHISEVSCFYTAFFKDPWKNTSVHMGYCMWPHFCTFSCVFPYIELCRVWPNHVQIRLELFHEQTDWSGGKHNTSSTGSSSCREQTHTSCPGETHLLTHINHNVPTQCDDIIYKVWMNGPVCVCMFLCV